MLTITQDAIHFIKEQMQKSQEGEIFRLSIKRTGCSGWMYVPDIIKEPIETDILVTSINNLIVYIDGNVKEFLENTTVDLEVKELGFRQLIFSNPNTKGVCGCGESFLIDENNDE